MILLPYPPAGLNPNKRLHHMALARLKASYREVCRKSTQVSGEQITWDGLVHAWITFVPPDLRKRDDDNCLSAFKSGRDGMADALGIDDNRIRVHPAMSDIPDRKGGRIEIRFTPDIKSASDFI